MEYANFKGSETHFLVICKRSATFLCLCSVYIPQDIFYDRIHNTFNLRETKPNLYYYFLSQNGPMFYFLFHY